MTHLGHKGPYPACESGSGLTVMVRKHVKLGRAPAKAVLPSKPSEACHRPFIWRRKWARDRDQVRHCSDRCREAARP